MMRSFERHTVILKLLQGREYVAIETLAQACKTSPQTIRRDLNTLEVEGKVQRYHGGARIVGDMPIATYEVRSASHVEEKEIAASLLVELVPDGSTLFLAGGSTLALAARSLRDRENLTIVTNNLHAAVALYDRTGFQLHMVGGFMRPASGSLTGDHTSRDIERFSLDIAVIGTCGIDGEGSLLEYDQSLVQPILAMMANARETILVADASKFNATGIVRGAHLRDVHHLVTSSKPSVSTAALLAEHNVQTHYLHRFGSGQSIGMLD
jgi:DeoR family glycerol-3-phosphate regulon repressor